LTTLSQIEREAKDKKGLMSDLCFGFGGSCVSKASDAVLVSNCLSRICGPSKNRLSSIFDFCSDGILNALATGAAERPYSDERDAMFRGGIYSGVKVPMVSINSVKLAAESEPLLLLHGGTPAARQILMRYLQSTNIGIRLIVIPVDWSVAGTDCDNSDLSVFFEELSARIGSLTEKERVVLQYVMDGHTNKSISLQLDLSERAIELRKASLMRKLNVTSHTELVCRITKFQTLQQFLVQQATSASAQTEAESVKSVSSHRSTHTNKSETTGLALISLRGTCFNQK
jgi:DNA-binding CsgD family transcriptional regulator